MSLVTKTGQTSLSSVELVNGQANLTDSSSTEVLAADADRFTYITDITIAAKAGASAILKIDILEATTVLMSFYTTVTTAVTGNIVVNLTTPIKTSAVNKAINAKSDGSPTGFDGLVTVSGFQAKN
tara:strand:+ start:272 stop:649 length:378 start_codon:yes stop_codon:yes gene_type:complete